LWVQPIPLQMKYEIRYSQEDECTLVKIYHFSEESGASILKVEHSTLYIVVRYTLHSSIMSTFRVYKCPVHYARTLNSSNHHHSLY